MATPFVTTTYQGNTETGDASGDMVEVETPQGTVVFRPGAGGETVVELPGIRALGLPRQIILES